MKTHAVIITILVVLIAAAPALTQERRGGALYESEPPEWMLPSPPIKLLGPHDEQCDLSPHFPPIRSQFPLNSCIAFAWAYYYKTYQEWEEHGWDVNDSTHQFSPSFMYNQINGGIDYGGYMGDAIKLLSDMGCATWADMPYDSTSHTTWPDEEDYYNALPYRCGQGYYIYQFTAGLEPIKNLLLNGHAAVTVIHCYTNFENIGNYNNTYCVSQVTLPYVWPHVVTLCGFDDDMETADGIGAFKLANSYGPDWGENGYFWMSYEAMLSSVTNQGRIDYNEDLIGYTPTFFTTFHVSHGDRYAIEYQFYVSWVWNKSFFNWYMPPQDYASYPPTNIVLDLTDGALSLDPSGTIISMYAFDTRINNGYDGEITYYSAEEQSWPALAVSPDPPVAIPDDGSASGAALTLEDLDLDVALTPSAPPITIPASGGSFDFNVAVTNNDTVSQTFDVWFMVTLPNGSQYGPILGPVELTLAAGGSLNRDRTQNVPAGAPPGEYTYHAYVGDYPYNMWDYESFPFEKLPGDDAPAHDYGWALFGWEEAPTVTDRTSPNSFVLYSAHPNPFNPTTTITYDLPEATEVALTVYDVSGRQVAILVDGWRNAGAHEITFDASNLSSGVYLYRLKAGKFNADGKMVLMK